MWRLLFLFALLAAASAQAQYNCTQGRNPMTLCKSCKDLTTVTYAFKPVGGVGCQYGCGTLCGWQPAAEPKARTAPAGEPPEQPDPRRDPMRGLDPSILDGLYDQDGKYCGPVPYMKPWNFYALQATDEQILALAKVSPPAAMQVAIAQIGGSGGAAPFEVGESIYPVLVTAPTVALLLRGEEDENAYAAASSPLAQDVGLITHTRVDRLRSGHRVIVVESELLHHPTLSTVGIPYPPFGIEIERVAGQTQPNDVAPDNPARVWRVVSWGPPERYFPSGLPAN
jgi:hypothetical protein